jgi:hypothetical protein
MTIPTYLTFYVLGGSVAIIAAVLFGLNRALEQARWAPPDRATAMRSVASTLIGWFAIAVALAWFGAYQGGSERIPTIQYGILVPILIGSVLIWRSALVWRLIEAVPQQWIVGVQLYRALGLIFLVLYASGKLPGLFAWPAGAGDIAVGLLAPIVAGLYAANSQRFAASVWAWNVFGIADLVVAVGTGFLTSPSSLQLFAFANPSEIISTFPLVLVPVYLVPLSILLHFASLAKLRHATASGRLKAVG